MVEGKIYKISNTVNNKVYIGQTIQSLSTRFSRHKQTKEMRCPHLSNAMDCYGKDKFSIELIDTAITKEELNEKEIYWIEYYDAVNNGYNIKDRNNNYVKRYLKEHSEKSKSKICKFTLEGKYIKSYNSIIEASKSENIRSGDISASCTQRQYYAKGYIWVYEEDRNNTLLINSKVNRKGICNSFKKKSGKEIEKEKNFSMYYKLKKFNQDQEIELFKLYYSVKYNQIQLAKIYECSRALIVKSLRMAEKQKRAKYLLHLKDNKNLKILQIDKQTKEIINIFDNAKDAERSINLVGVGVNRALNSNKNDGSPRTAGGFIWKRISAKDLAMIEEQQEIEKIIDNES